MRGTIACVLLAFGAAISPAAAQNVDAVMERANRINQFMALLEHNDPSVRIAAFEEGVTAPDPLFRKRAIEAGLVSRDGEVRSLAIVAHLKTEPLFVIEVPEGVRLSSEQTRKAESWGMPITLRADRPKEIEPGRFEASLSRYSVTCRTTGGILRCVGGASGMDLEITPSAAGLFTGKLGVLPVIYKYK